MKVFLSWSGESSQNVAKALRDWLPCVLQAVRPVMSTEDIDKGTRWSDELAKQLDETAYGILCLTSYNISAPWLNFEAGAISKALERSRVSPFLFRVNRERVTGPLQQFQFTLYKDDDARSKEDIFSLLTSLNRSLAAADEVSHEVLRREFEMWWSTLEKSLKAITVSADEISGQPGHPRLISHDDLIDIHMGLDFKTAWFVVSDWSQQIDNPRLLPAVDDRLGRNAAYTIFTRKSSPQNERIRRLKDALASLQKIIVVVESEDEEFQRLVVTDFVIFSPESTIDPEKRRVFLELPTDPRGYWILATSEAANGLVDRFDTLRRSALANDVATTSPEQH